MSTPSQQLQQLIGDALWRISQPATDNISDLLEADYPGVCKALNAAIPGLYLVVIYYPVLGGEYHHRIEYTPQQPITPLQVLSSISEFYAQPFTQENAEAIGDLLNEGFDYEPQPGDT